MDPEVYCKEKILQSGSSFYYSFLFLPAEQRRALTALYAFCREIDDVVDECSEPALARVKLNFWRQEIDALYSGTPSHPVTQALKQYLPTVAFEQEWFLKMIDGMEMDLDHNCFQTFDDLYHYCYHAASLVGMQACRIFQVEDEASYKFAEYLGLALQLINIIRDVGEDARRGRVYLALDDLQKYDLSAEAILAGTDLEKLPKILADYDAKARDYFSQAMALLPQVDRPKHLASIIMAQIYLKLLTAISTTNYQVYQQKIALTPLRKFWAAWKCYRREKSICRTIA